MADVYEQNLEQKSTLTTSDYIRVVGSDNVSYKQQMDIVSKAVVENAYLNPPTALASGADVLTLAVGVYYTASNDIASSLVNAPSELSLNCRVEVEGRLPNRKMVTISDSANNVWKNQMTSASTWSGWYRFSSQPSADAVGIVGMYRLNNAHDAITGSFTVPNNSRHFLLFTGPYSNRGHAVYAISCNGSGGVYAIKIGGTSDMPASATGTGNSVTIRSTATSATYCAVTDMVITGTVMSIVS